MAIELKRAKVHLLALVLLLGFQRAQASLGAQELIVCGHLLSWLAMPSGYDG